MLEHAFHLFLPGLKGIGFCWLRDQICHCDTSAVDHIEKGQQMIIKFQMCHGRDLQMVIAKRIPPVCGYGVVTIHLIEDGVLRANGCNRSENEMHTVVFVCINSGKASAIGCVENALFLCEKRMYIKIWRHSKGFSYRGILQHISVIKINGYPKGLVDQIADGMAFVNK